ncbi:PAS domain S-box protein [Leptothoe spongobia]|nr:PAS domain S-box protein [Leptothoe spongobia]
MQNTIMILQQEVEQLRNEQTQLLQEQNLQLENQVTETEERFRAIFNQTFQFIGLLNPDGILLETNQTALEFGGLKREDVINRPFWETHWWQISLETQQQLQAAITQAAQGEFIRYEVDIQGIHGKIITIDFSLRPVVDEAGSVKWLIPEGRNINDLKRTQEELKQSQKHYANLAEAAPVGIFQTDADGNCCYVNEQWCQIAGLSAEEAMGMGWVTGLHPDDRQRVAAEWYRAAQTNDLFRSEYRFQSLSSGQVTWVLGQSVSETDLNGQVNGYIGTIVNITERKQAELELAQNKANLEISVDQRTAELEVSRQRHADMYQKTPVMFHSIDWQGRIRHVSDYWLEKLGYTQDEVIGHKSTEFLTPESCHYAETVVLPEYFKTGVCSDIPYQIVTKGGQVIDVLLSANSHQDTSGQRMSLAVMVDVTASNQKLYREKELAQVTLQSIADAVITTDAQGYIEFINPVAEELTGWKAAEAQGVPLTQAFRIINEITRTSAENPVEKVLRDGQIAGLANHTALISKSGIEYSIEDSAAPIRNRAGDIIGAVMVFHDVTHARQLQRDLSWQASHDSLTELVNRQRFEQELDVALQSLIHDDQTHVLCFLDLDQFKIVNDTCGHTAGDELLRQVSQLLKKQIRAIDLLARLGGDEFGILLKQCSLEAAQAITQKVLSAVQDFRFVWQDKVFSIGVSIGLVSLDMESILTEVLSAADSACYAAKNKGRNRIQIYESHDLELINQRGERHWSLQIKHALEENRFCLYRQVIASTTHPPETAYEVLLRMVDSQGNLITPEMFIPAAERYNLMPAIDRWVIKTFLDYVEQTLTGYEDETISDIHANKLHFINLSGNSIGDPLFLEFIKEEFKQHDFSLQNIGFEITETTAISNLQQATHFIHELKQLGCQFSLDDFGSGMSSFGYLKNLPVDYLKIDGHFIKDIIADSATYAIVESINHVGHVMGLKTIAEYVENYPLRECLDNMGVDYVQGFGISRPAPIISVSKSSLYESECP